MLFSNLFSHHEKTYLQKALSPISKSIILILIFFSLIAYFTPSVAEGIDASRIEQSREDLDKEEALRKRISQEEKVFIKKVVVSGITLLDKEQVRETLLPYEGHWLSKEDIAEMLNSILQLYQKYNYQPGYYNSFFNNRIFNFQIYHLLFNR